MLEPRASISLLFQLMHEPQYRGEELPPVTYTYITKYRYQLSPSALLQMKRYN